MTEQWAWSLSDSIAVEGALSSELQTLESSTLPTRPPWQGAAVRLPLVRAKLQRPRLGTDLLIREKLFARLDDGLNRNLTLVSAPAGFGKTTLLATWLRERGHVAAWVSLDAGDNDLPSFVNDLTTAIDAQVSDTCRELRTMLSMPHPMPADLLASLLSNELGELQDDLVVVLDDYQVVEDSAVHLVINELASRPPPHLHLVIAARFDPPLALTRLRGSGQLQEIRARDLRFDAQEASEFLVRALGPRLDPAAVASVHARTEGWVTGLRLAAISLADDADPVAFARSFSGDSRQIADFLMEEVLLRLPRPMHDFLLTTSIVDRICGPLCDALLPGGDHETSASELLEWAERTSLFITPLDDEHRWYRYHHLFRGLLQRELQARSDRQAIRELHQCASAWFASQGLLEEAVVQLLAADDPLAAVKLVEDHVHPLLNREAWRTLGRLLELLPEPVRERSALMAGRAWMLHFRGQRARVPAILDTLRAQLENGHDAVSSEVQASLDAMVSYGPALDNTRVGLDRARDAVARIPADNGFARGFAELHLAVQLYSAGRSAEALNLLNTALAECGDRDPARSSRLLAGLAECELAAGNLPAFARAARRLLQTGEEHNLPLTLGWAHYLLGRVAYEWDDVPAANKHFATVIQLREHVHFKALREATLGLAMTIHVMGDPPRAHRAIDELLRLADAVPAPEFGVVIQTFKARLLLSEGDSQGAAQWLSAVDLTVLQYPSVLEMEVPRLTEVQELAALGSAAAHREALEKLDDLVRWHTGRAEACCTLRVLAVKALVLESQHKTADALAALRQAITLAAPGRFVRSFVDLGEPMRELLLRLHLHDATTWYVSFLLSRFPGTSETPVPRSDRDTPPIEALTARETEILDLLVRRLSNKEIAERLVISDNTVKRHNVSLYQKLHVTGRQAAVAKAVSLGLVSTK